MLRLPEERVGVALGGGAGGAGAKPPGSRGPPRQTLRLVFCVAVGARKELEDTG